MVGYAQQFFLFHPVATYTEEVSQRRRIVIRVHTKPSNVNNIVASATFKKDNAMLMWHIRTPPKPQHAGQHYRAQQQLDARQANHDLRTYNLVPHLPHLQPSLEY